MKSRTLYRFASLFLLALALITPAAAQTVTIAQGEGLSVTVPYSSDQPFTKLQVIFNYFDGLTFTGGSSASMTWTGGGAFESQTPVTNGAVTLHFRANADAASEQAVMVEGIIASNGGDGTWGAGSGFRTDVTVTPKAPAEVWPETWVTGTAPTCEVPGSRYRMSNLGNREDQVIPALGHAFGAWQVVAPATYEAAGLERRVCAHDARHVETRPIPIKQIVWGDWQVVAPATCELPGLERRVNTLDSGKYENREIPALGHKAGQWVVNKLPTFTEPGSRVLQCAVDGAVMKREVIPAQTLPEAPSSTLGVDGTAFPSDGDGDQWGSYRKINVSNEGLQSFRLVDEDGTIYGQVHVLVKHGQVTLSHTVFSPYRVLRAGANLSPDLGDLTAQSSTGLQAAQFPFDQPISIQNALGGRSHQYLYLNLQVERADAAAGNSTAMGGPTPTPAPSGNGITATSGQRTATGTFYTTTGDLSAGTQATGSGSIAAGSGTTALGMGSTQLSGTNQYSGSTPIGTTPAPVQPTATPQPTPPPPAAQAVVATVGSNLFSTIRDSLAGAEEEMRNRLAGMESEQSLEAEDMLQLQLQVNLFTMMVQNVSTMNKDLADLLKGIIQRP